MNLSNSSDPWLSVVTVVRDDPEGFESTAESFQRQARYGVEFIVIDSSIDSDSIPRVLDLFPSLHGQYHWVQPRGIYPAMNKGLERAQGKYVMFANAGDVFFSDGVLGHIYRSVSEIDPVWLVGRVGILDSLGNLVITAPFDFGRERARLFARGKFPPHQGTVARVDALRSLGGFSTEYAIAADYHAALRLGEVSSPLVSNEVFMKFSEGGLSTQQWQKSFQEFHRAREAVYAPRGVARWVEFSDTYWHYFRVWVYRNVLARPRTSKNQEKT